MVLPTMNDNEKAYEAFRIYNTAIGIYNEYKGEIWDKFRRGTKFPYVQRIQFNDDRNNKWLMLIICKSKKAVNKEKLQAREDRVLRQDPALAADDHDRVKGHGEGEECDRKGRCTKKALAPSRPRSAAEGRLPRARKLDRHHVRVPDACALPALQPREPAL